MKTAHPTLGFLPLQIEDPVAWVGHLPFAYWLTGVVRPRVFFELGTHSGNSYFTFCQAVREHGLQTRCNAVDLWTGDRHTGAYESTIYEIGGSSESGAALRALLSLEDELRRSSLQGPGWKY